MAGLLAAALTLPGVPGEELGGFESLTEGSTLYAVGVPVALCTCLIASTVTVVSAMAWGQGRRTLAGPVAALAIAFASLGTWFWITNTPGLYS